MYKFKYIIEYLNILYKNTNLTRISLKGKLLDINLAE
jgi:hypothetical protein